MQIFVCRGLSGEIARMEIDGENSFESQMQNMARKLFGADADGGAYVLINLTRDFEYSPNDVIGETTYENDVLLLIKSDNISGFE